MKLTTTLRPSYQLPMFLAMPELLAEHKHLLIQAPAGSGKSVIMSHWVAHVINRAVEMSFDKGCIPVVLTHRTTIQQQLLVHCQGISIDSEVEHVFITKGVCYVAMNQTLVRRTAIMKQLYALGNRIMLIADEAHYSIFNKIMDALPEAYRIGFSATPAWRWAKHLPVYYKHLLPGPQISQLTEEGALVKFEYHEMKTNLEGLATNSTGEYTEQSQFEVFEKNGLFDGLTTELRNFEGMYSKGAIFCSSIKQCDTVHATLHEQGFNPVKCHSKLKDATYQKARFEKLNESNLMVSVSSLAEGWDFPSLDFEVLYRATTSLPLYIQMGMRCSRPSPNKQKSIVLDFGENNSRFGGSNTLCSMTMDRDWTELWQPPKKVKEGGGTSSIKLCPCCEYMLHASSRSCCNCGYIYPEAEVLLKVGELVRIQEEKKANDSKVTGRRISTLDPIELAYYAKNANKVSFAIRIARSKQLEQIINKETTGSGDVNWLQLFGSSMSSYVPGKYGDSWLNYQLRTLNEERSYAHSEGKELEMPFADVIVKI